MSGVPACNVVRRCRENACLGDPEEEPCREETIVIVNDAHQSHNNSPGNSYGRYYSIESASIFFPRHRTPALTPDAGREIFQGHISRYLEDNIGNEEYSKSNVVLLACHLQVFFQTSEPCVANIAPK